MATIQEISKLAGVSPATVSRVLRNIQPFSEQAYEKVMEAQRMLQADEATSQLEQRATIRDVAALAGVSISTVSNVLNNYPVTEAICIRVKAAVEELKYEPNIAGRSLRKGRDFRIIAAVSNPHWRALQGIYTAADELECDVLLMHSGINTYDSYIQRLEGGLAQGILFFDFFDAPVVEEFGQRYHVVQCGGCTNVENVSSVSSDYFLSAKELTHELIRQGRKKICAITGRSNSGFPVSFLDDFISGYRQAQTEENLTVHVEDWNNTLFLTYDYMRQKAFVDKIFSVPKEEWPDAFITPTGELAALLIQAIREKGLQVPNDIAVAAFLSSGNYKETYPYITSMHQDWYTIGYESVKLLFEHIRTGCRETERVIMPHTIVYCGSTHPELFPFGEFERTAKDQTTRVPG